MISRGRATQNASKKRRVWSLKILGVGSGAAG